jgi:hypothetical protein
MNCDPYANPVTAVNTRAFFCEIIDADVAIVVVDTSTRNESNHIACMMRKNARRAPGR